MNLITCIDAYYGIGYKGELLFNIREDRDLFRLLTSGETVIMGSETYKSIGGPLPNRKNVVFTRNEKKDDSGVIFCGDIDKIVKEAGNNAFVIGGEFTYRTFLPYCDTAYITHIINAFKTSDRKFPDFVENIIENNDWKCIVETCTYHDEAENVLYRFMKLIRK